MPTPAPTPTPVPETPTVTLPLYETEGVLVTLNKDKTLAKFEDENGDTPVAVEIATKYLDMNIKMLKVERVNETISALAGKDYIAYEITFVNKDGNVVPVKGDAKVRVPVGLEVDKAYYITSDTKQIVHEVPFEKGEDDSVRLTVNHFSLYAVTFKKSTSTQPVKPATVDEQPNNLPSTQAVKPENVKAEATTTQSTQLAKPESEKEQTVSTQESQSMKNEEVKTPKETETNQRTTTEEKVTRSEVREELPKTGSVSSLGEMIAASFALLGGVFVSKKRKK